MRLAITGSHGLIGSALAAAAAERGWRVQPLVRTGTEPGGDAIPWDPNRGLLDSARLDGVDAVVNLAGASLDRRWTAARKRELVDSRVPGTRLLAGTLAKLPRPPPVLVSASAVGWYGDRGAAELTESSPRGSGFLAGLCEEWERATEPAARAGIRVACTRFGLVLSTRGGALKKMLPVFRLGLGGPLGSGRQVWSWVTIDDVVRGLLQVIETPALAGAVNLTSPEPVANREFARALGRALHRPAVFPAPAVLLRAAFGEMAGMILTGQRVLPGKLLASGFAFRHARLDEAFDALLEPATAERDRGRSTPGSPRAASGSCRGNRAWCRRPRGTGASRRRE